MFSDYTTGYRQSSYPETDKKLSPVTRKSHDQSASQSVLGSLYYLTHLNLFAIIIYSSITTFVIFELMTRFDHSNIHCVVLQFLISFLRITILNQRM